MERRADFDILRGIGIIAVVLGHCGILSKLVYLFHIPLFIFVSGVLAGYYEGNSRKINESLNRKEEFLINVRKKIARLYFPFVGLQLFFLVFHNLLVKYHLYSSGSLSGYGFLTKIIQILTLGGGESLGGALWFLICLFEISILWEILRLFRNRISEKCFRFGVIVLAIVLYVIGMKITLPRLLNISFFLFIYYALGWCTEQNNPRLCASKQSWIAFIVAAGLLFYGMRKEISYNDMNTPFLAFLMASAGIFCSAAIAKIISKFHFLTRIFEICGIYSFSIMALHFTGFKVLSIALYLFGVADVSSLANLCPAETLNIWIRFLYCIVGIVFSIGVSFLFHECGRKHPNLMKYLTGQWLLATMSR